VAASDIEHPICVNGGCHNVRRHSSAFPEGFARIQIESANSVGAANYYLWTDNSFAVLAFNDDRGAPRSIFATFPAPTVLAGSLVQNHEKGTILVIPIHNERIAIEGG